ncbi:putative MFS family arabinose efflux permease [Amycolatopsis sulphurea]|uniref:Putative MFS family arabinose efflux permease n=1 Tax=Amycolatopsis sulphurea TaxID=76022 RepID=A0A2A9G1J9_9PSEU|nr:MFS transporter [Amycolatopsis sulphurea]PFG56826.1 putative MFS family arabinose efflux permease [Amycolatopsis sulphurea]
MITATPPTTRTTWLPAAAAVFVCGWGGNQFTPLLVMYQAAGYSAFTVDALLGAYVLGLVPALLASGGLSTRFGRRPVMLAGTACSLVASALIALGPLGAGWIAAGRFLTGVAVAVAMAVGSTWIKELADLDPRATPDVGTRRAALCLTLGLGAGPGIAGVLAQWGPLPMILPYIVHIGLTVIALPFAARGKETLRLDALQTPARRGLPGTTRHPRFRRVIVPSAPWIFGSCGIAYAVMPQLVHDRLGSWSLCYSTLLTVCAIGAGVGIQPIAKRVDRTNSARAILTGMTVMCAGLAMSAAAAAERSPWLALLTALVLGTAYGIVVVSGLLELQRLAQPTEIAELTGIFYALAYLGFLLPSLLAALNGVAGYPMLLSCLAVLALGGTAVIARHSRRHLPAD